MTGWRLKFSIRRTFADIWPRFPIYGMRGCQGDGTVGSWHDFLSLSTVLPRWHGQILFAFCVKFRRQAPGDKLRDARREVAPDKCHGREWLRGLGSGKCHTGDGGAVYAESTEVVEANLGIWRGGFNAESAEDARDLLGAEYRRASVLERSEFVAPVTGRARRKRPSPLRPGGGPRPPGGL